jgi:hypothetical protein
VTARRVALLLVAALAVYLVFAAARAWALISTGAPVPVLMGLAVLVIPVIGAWLVWREVAFGFGMQAMGRTLEAEGGLPVDDLPRSPSGRVQTQAADERFVRVREEVDAHPDDWRRWYVLAIAYDDARDRRRARAAMRRALALYRG